MYRDHFWLNFFFLQIVLEIQSKPWLISIHGLARARQLEGAPIATDAMRLHDWAIGLYIASYNSSHTVAIFIRIFVETTLNGSSYFTGCRCRGRHAMMHACIAGQSPYPTTNLNCHATIVPQNKLKPLWLPAYWISPNRQGLGQGLKNWGGPRLPRILYKIVYNL